MAKVKSTVPGMQYPSGRDHFLKTPFGFLEGRRKDDGAEGLWRIRDSLYDLQTFIKNHPGGAEWIEMTKGTDITEAFEVHHITDKAERMLSKFYVRKAAQPRALHYTFEPSGFYRKFKERAREALKNVDFHRPTTRSILIADFIATLTILSAIAVAVYKSWIIIAVSALLLTWTTIIAHNFFHMRDNFRMYYFDLSLMSSKEWRISHALSHHMYPNTIWDMEIYALEPFLEYHPHRRQFITHRLFSILISPIVFCSSYLAQGLKRYYSVYKEWKKPEFRDIVPFFLPVIMSIFASSPLEAIKLWLCIIVLSSTFFNFIGKTAAHHHPDIFHDGDTCRKDLDWGLMELDAVRDRKIIDDSLFLVLTNFGSHGLHHLLPTVDHAHLELCLPAFRETCREFGIDYDGDKLNSWQLFKGSYEQILRTKPKRNFRGKPETNGRSP